MVVSVTANVHCTLMESKTLERMSLWVPWSSRFKLIEEQGAHEMQVVPSHGPGAWMEYKRDSELSTGIHFSLFLTGCSYSQQPHASATMTPP